MTGRGVGVAARGWGWRHAGRKAWAVKDVTLRIEPGERVLLLGPSGAGKSTLLAGLAGLLGGADEGEEAGRLLLDDAAPVERRGRAGLVLQDPDASVVLSRVGDDVAFGPENLGVSREEIWRRVSEALADVGLDLPLDHPTARLSGGQKQRLAIAGVLAMHPGLLLLDEPTANLDPVGVAEVRDAVERVVTARGSTLIVVEHRTEVWADLMTRVIVLDAAGGLLADGAPSEVFGRRADELARAGVWVPGARIDLPCVTGGGGELLIRADDLTVGRRRGAPAASGIDLDVRAGGSLVVTGPNGAGKSTLALSIAGLIPPLHGRLEGSAALRGRRGLRPADWSSRELLTRVGSVFQDPEHQFVARTVREELAVGPNALGWPAAARNARVDELLERLGLARLAEANPFTLSGGQKRRLSVGTILAAGPRVMVLDEPTFGQDRVSWVEVVRLLQEQVERGTALVSVTHDPAVLEHLGGVVLPLDAARRKRAA